LSALMADVAMDEVPQAAEMRIPIEKIEPNPDQPRRAFSQEGLEELAASIRQKGVIQPLVLRVHPSRDGMYEIVAGERRWRAAQLARQHDLPAVIRDFDDTEVLEVAIIENVQRADLNPVEEAAAYRQLMERFGHTQEKLAEALGKSRSHIANLMRLLQLPSDVQDLLRAGQISAGHARALIVTDNPSELARQVAERGLSVRETERLAKGPAAQPSPPRPHKAIKDADTQALERDLSAALGMKVEIAHAGKGGSMTIRYEDLDQLDDLCRRLNRVIEPA
jgi:ParB family chromosome partitioning protein